jgi:hypothetical protein
MKLPGTYVAYAAILTLFRENIWGIHLGLVFVNAATAVLVFALGRRLANERVGLVAGATFAFLSMSPSLLGLAAHATHFVLLPAIAGFLFLLSGIDRGRKGALFAAGLLLGVAFLMKQQGVLFGIFGGMYLLYSELRAKPIAWKTVLVRTMWYSAGAILPFAVTCVALYSAGVFERFWFWTFTYAREYAGSLTLSEGWQVFTNNFSGYTKPTVLLWITAGLGLLEMAFRWRQWPRNGFVAGFLLFSFLAVCPGFYFRNHYFILMLPAVGILAGLAVHRASALLALISPGQGWTAMAGFAGLIAVGVYNERAILLQLSPDDACRATYGVNPFPESLQIARFIRENSSVRDKIAILGSEPQLCFYAERRLASGFLYTYALMEPQPYALQMQRDMIREMEAANPKLIVLVNIPTSWLARPDSHQLIFEWFEKYAGEKLQQIGYVDFLSDTERAYHLGDREGRTTRPRSPYSILIFQQKATH